MSLLVDRDIIFYALRYVIYNDRNRISDILKEVNRNIYKFSNNDIEMLHRELDEGDMGEIKTLIRTDILQRENNMYQEKEYYVCENILLDALKYSVGRMSYAPSVVKENIKYNLQSISEEFVKEVKDHIDGCKNLGMRMDQENWMEFSKSL